MKTRKIISRLAPTAIAAIILILNFTIAAHGAETVNLRFMTGPVGGNWNILGEVLAKAWSSAQLSDVSRRQLAATLRFQCCRCSARRLKAKVISKAAASITQCC